jgi:hypothetical protein
VFSTINNDWSQFGGIQVYINYTIAGLRGFTYNDLLGADVLWLSDSGTGCGLSSDEVYALETYASGMSSFTIV